MVSVSRQESDTRYAAIPNEITAAECQRRFLRAVDAICVELEDYTSCGGGMGVVTTIQADCRGLAQLGLQPGSFAGAVFSPPYPNAYEYWLYHKYRAYWLDGDPSGVRDLEIGARPHYSKPNNLTDVDFANDLRPVFSALHGLLEVDGKVAVVVGDSVIKGELIDNGSLVNRVAKDSGFSLLAHAHRELPAGRRSFRARRLRNEHVLMYARSEL